MRISKTSNKVKATWSASVRTPAAIAEHTVQASLWLVWGKQDLPFTTDDQKYRNVKASNNYSFPFSPAWGVGLGNLFGHPKHATMLGTPHSKDWLSAGDSWVNRTVAAEGPECAGGESWLCLRICCPGATRSRGTEVHDILGRTSVLSHRSSQPSTEGTGKMLYLPKRNMTSFSNYELLMSPTVSSTRALAKQGEQM